MGIRKTYRRKRLLILQFKKRLINIFSNKRLAYKTCFNADSYKNIPIIINNFNRLDYLKRLIFSLEDKGYYNLIILDNQSLYPPLLEYYNTIPYRVIYLDKNYGHTALWTSGVIEQFNKDFFIYTDPDMEIPSYCPDDFGLYFIKELLKRPNAEKIGFALKIDDLPDYYKFKDDVIAWEQHFFEIKEDTLFRADIDTTFALHRPTAPGGYVDDILTYRTAYPYEIRHLPWYENSDMISEEERYYLANKRKEIGWWSSKTELK